MTWTYTSTDPGGTNKDWVRLKIGDTSSGDQLLQDEEITALLTDAGAKRRAAVLACRSIGARFARRADKGVGKLNIAASQAAKAYFDLALTLEREQAVSVAPYAGGISIADKEIDLSDSDRVDPLFTVGQYDDPGTVEGSTY